MTKSKKNPIKHLLDLCDRYFPNKSKYLLAMLATYAILGIKNISGTVPTLVIVGRPSSRKSTLCEILSVLDDKMIWIDDFTSKAFVSAAPGLDQDGGRVDLLSIIKNKLLITPELGTLFKNKNLKEILGILTRILDGKGFTYATGMGQVGYRGNYFFCWIGAVVEIPAEVWKVLQHLGNRLFFIEITPDLCPPAQIEEQLDSLISRDMEYDEKISIVQKALLTCLEKINFEIGSISWNRSKDDTTAKLVIRKCAMLLRSLRAGQNTKVVDGKRILDRAILEDPVRSMAGLYNLARGTAILDGRNYIKVDDVTLIVKITLDSCPMERRLLFRALVENEGTVTEEQFMLQSHLSRESVRLEFQKVANIGMIDIWDKPQPVGKPLRVVKLKPDFDWYLQDDFKKYLDF